MSQISFTVRHYDCAIFGILDSQFGDKTTLIAYRVGPTGEKVENKSILTCNKLDIGNLYSPKMTNIQFYKEWPSN